MLKDFEIKKAISLILILVVVPLHLPVCNYFDSGELFAVGSFNTLRLCDKTGVSIVSCKYMYEKLLL